jgi:hypothetical protein
MQYTALVRSYKYLMGNRCLEFVEGVNSPENE